MFGSFFKQFFVVDWLNFAILERNLPSLLLIYMYIIFAEGHFSEETKKGVFLRVFLRKNGVNEKILEFVDRKFN